MKTVEAINVENYSCDECKKTMDKPYIHLEMIDDIGMRLIENKQTSKSRHLTYGRKEIDLCSVDCGKKYLGKSIEELLWEVVKT